jgi:hypothetical protein
LSSGTTCVTDWSFSFRCSPPRIAATQLRFDTARLFAAQKRTSTALSHCPLRRTSADFSRLSVNNTPGVPAWTNEESKPTEVGAPVLRDPAVVVLTRCALMGNSP